MIMTLTISTGLLIPVIAQENPSRVQLMHWGLIPAWSRDGEEAEQIRKGTYNARTETLHEKLSFRGPLNHGRCLIVAGGFFLSGSRSTT